ncbi:hypothetical protein [Psychromonas ossibalaenae]|uniref:hypothetical protein n=1 Tax=Psychromonas ossibalaenae TaxID=444922 RepID=UPI000366E4DB|nr:hypothetical protein [Psychromonas ossibalaenae]
MSYRSIGLSVLLTLSLNAAVQADALRDTTIIHIGASGLHNDLEHTESLGITGGVTRVLENGITLGISAMYSYGYKQVRHYGDTQIDYYKKTVSDTGFMFEAGYMFTTNTQLYSAVGSHNSTIERYDHIETGTVIAVAAGVRHFFDTGVYIGANVKGVNSSDTPKHVISAIEIGYSF